MAILRKTFSQGRMNLDVDNRLLGDGEYREATNVVVLNNEANQEGSVRKSFSTKKITNLDLGLNPICLGTYAHNARNKVYWLILSDTGTFLIEYDFNNNVSSFVLKDTRPISTRVFNLKKDFYCTAISIISHEDVEKELLLMSDDNIEPLCINIERAKKYGENGFDKEDIFLIKKPPRYAPRAALSYSTEKSNNIEEKFLRFSYRYQYLDNEWSALSSFTNSQFSPKPYKIDYFSQDNLGMINAFNAILLTINTGDKRVKSVQVVFKEDNSNTVYVIETFKKNELGWLDNSFKSFSFANNKVYTALPEKELYRSFDNVPLKAKSLTTIVNLCVFGNYTEGFNIAKLDGTKINIDYTVGIVKTRLNEFNTLNVVVSNSAGGNNTMQITNATGFSLVKDNNINFTIAIRNNTNQIFNEAFSYSLLKNYTNLGELFIDPDFIFFVSIISSVFNNKNTYSPGNNTIQTEAIITPYVVSSNVVGLNITPIVINSANVLTNIYLNFSNLSVANVTEISSSSSCKSNRDYVIAIVYLDPFNRKTVALTSLKNSFYILNELSSFKNELQIKIKNEPPAFADRYKIVVKTPALSYYTITVNTFYQDGAFIWIRLEGSDKDKVQVGQYLILKRTPTKVQGEVIKTKILEINVKEKNFLDVNGTDEPSGLYIKIKPTGFNMNANDNKTYSNIANERNGNENFPICYLRMSFDNAPVDFLKAGTVIILYFKSEREYDAGWSTSPFEKSYTLQRNYANITEWYNEIVLGTSMPAGGQGGNYLGKVNLQNDGFLQVTGLYQGNGSSWDNLGGFVDAKITVLASAGDYIFETEPEINLENNFFYETQQTFNIVNGVHIGNVQNQNLINGDNAIVKLDFFNCYSQGNGVESYMIKDGYNKPFLNINTSPTTTSIVEYEQVRRSADLTYSESFVESSNINGLNVFNLSTANFKDDLDKEYGSIQKLYSRENDIVVLQENKAGKVLFDKDAIYSADGNATLTSITNVLGRYIPYQGNRGIGTNPESFSVDDYGRIKYASVRNGTIVRLSTDGIEDITYGLRNFFRNLFIKNSKTKIISGFDAFLNLTFFSVGDEVQKISRFNCNDQIIKSGQDAFFQYELLLNNLGGNVVFTYNITFGTATIEVLFNNVLQVVSNVSGFGSIIVPRTTLLENIALVTVTPISETIDYLITNTCPVGTQLEIITVILNDSQDSTKSIKNQFKSNTNPYISNDDVFTDGPVTRFESLIGIESVNYFPVNGDLITIEAVKESTNTGKLEISNCNRLGYLISNIVYSSAQYQAILDNPNTQFLTLTEIGETNFLSKVSGQFLFNRNLLNEKLYLIWDYTDRKPILADDSVTLNKAENTVINVLANDSFIPSAVTVTIITQPLNGTAIVNADKTITYTHSGTSTLTDIIIYKVSTGTCSSTAVINIIITIPSIPCNGVALPGGAGVTELVVLLDKPLGGIVIIDFNAQSVVDKLEILHNNVKKSTSGMTTPNAGPFDDIYGSPTVPTGQETTIDQFIGTSKGTIPNRDAVFLSETGITDIIRTKQQLIWFVYSAADYNISNQVTVRVTGPNGTAWDFTRLCTVQTPT